LDADQADLLLTAGLRFRGNSVEDHRALIGNEIHRGALIRSQDLLAHVLLFGDRAELRRGEDEGLALIDRPPPAGVPVVEQAVTRIAAAATSADARELI